MMRVIEVGPGWQLYMRDDAPAPVTEPEPETFDAWLERMAQAAYGTDGGES